MPRLSIIVPFRKDDARFEATLLSVLENRPEDVEVLVPHAGPYTDPYDISDEVLLIETDEQRSHIGLLNDALTIAQAPIIHVLMDGVVAHEGWVEEALDAFRSKEVNVVSPAITDIHSSRVAVGLDRKTIWQHGLATQPNRVAGPLLSACFFRRSLLCALDGWREDSSEQVAEIDMCLALMALGINCEVIASTQLKTEFRPISAPPNYVLGQRIGELCAAYESLLNHRRLAEGCKPGLVQRLFNCMNFVHLPGTIGWSIGHRNLHNAVAITERIQIAKEHLAAAETPVKLGVYGGSGSRQVESRPASQPAQVRRAA